MPFDIGRSIEKEAVAPEIDPCCDAMLGILQRNTAVVLRGYKKGLADTRPFAPSQITQIAASIHFLSSPFGAAPTFCEAISPFL